MLTVCSTFHVYIWCHLTFVCNLPCMCVCQESDGLFVGDMILILLILIVIGKKFLEPLVSGDWWNRCILKVSFGWCHVVMCNASDELWCAMWNVYWWFVYWWHVCWWMCIAAALPSRGWLRVRVRLLGKRCVMLCICYACIMCNVACIVCDFDTVSVKKSMCIWYKYNISVMWSTMVDMICV